jgi:hypothetical protein
MPGWTSTMPAISADSATHQIVTRRIHRSAVAHCDPSRTSSPVKAGMYVTGGSPLGHALHPKRALA